MIKMIDNISRPRNPDETSGVNTFVSQPSMDSNTLMFRLNTQPLMDDIEVFLRGQRIVMEEDKNGRIISMVKTIGKPLVNNEGVQGILSYISMIINPHTVQGNYKEERWENEVMNIRKELAYLLTLNTVKWNMNTYNRAIISDSIMNLIKPFMSRLIANKERESYGQTMQRVESSVVGRKGIVDSFNPFKK